MPETIIFKHKTPSREVEIEFKASEIKRKTVSVRKEKFDNLCRDCRCFKHKYSCPPYSPCFSKVSCKSRDVQVICFKMPLTYFAPLSPYQAQHAANAVLKGMMDRKLLEMRTDGLFVLGSGSCKACKPCNASKGLPCKRPEKKLTSLESVGIDVSKLVHDCFGFDLQWLGNGSIPEFTCTIGAILL